MYQVPGLRIETAAFYTDSFGEDKLSANRLMASNSTQRMGSGVLQKLLEPAGGPPENSQAMPWLRIACEYERVGLVTRAFFFFFFFFFFF